MNIGDLSCIHQDLQENGPVTGRVTKLKVEVIDIIISGRRIYRGTDLQRSLTTDGASLTPNIFKQTASKGEMC